MCCHYTLVAKQLAEVLIHKDHHALAQLWLMDRAAYPAALRCASAHCAG
jgi:hypothetical protein